MSSKPESAYYPIVLDYLKNELSCVTESWNSKREKFKFERRGGRRLIADVYGLRGTDEINSRVIEGIAVEVKRRTKGTAFGDIPQALKYERIAHRCYLAQPIRFNRETVAESTRVGVGLLEIHGNRVIQIADSKFFTPDSDAFHIFLERSLKIIRCALCGCYRFRYRNLDHRQKTGGHWRIDQIATQLPRNKDKKKEDNKKVYFCQECEELLFGKGLSR